ncbi:hypothetical protein GFJ94_06650 [Flavobacterium sp. LMO8]|uniref:hypothetical protein n=1 Tax=Flavobacterium sp. LMO8 TaxID=2654244 RepID=UPI001290E2CF|nr:hypothetical protein [Flavobacterium sp. LMO8]MQP24741.1 hypothetical protein [Flavobacterium sp. LMO8]
MKNLKRMSIFMMLFISIAVSAQEGFPDDDVDDVPTAPITIGVYPMLIIGVLLGFYLWKKQDTISE